MQWQPTWPWWLMLNTEMLTKYRLSAHSLAIDTGWFRKHNFQQRSDCANSVEELPWRQSSPSLHSAQNVDKSRIKHQQFKQSGNEKLKVALGEMKESCIPTGRFVSACHNMREPDWPADLHQSSDSSFLVMFVLCSMFRNFKLHLHNNYFSSVFHIF